MERSQAQRIHLDHLNGAPLLPEAASAITRALASLANPSAPYAEGRAAARLLGAARVQVAALVGARPEEILFTSSGTEANLWALTGLARAGAARGRHIVVSAVEHLSVLQTARKMEKEGWAVTRLPVDRTGRVDPDRLEEALTPQTALVSLQWASGEVGTVQPMAELARRAGARGIPVHSDAIAAAGRVPVDVREAPVDALSLAGNVWGGPPGVGALYLRKGTRILPLFVGGAQEEGRRAGTENLLGIVGMGEAAATAAGRLAGLADPLREKLVRGILNLVPEATLNGHPTERLPGHASVSFPGVDAEQLVLSLDMEGVAAGLGSACTFQARKPSHVLKAMGIADAAALGTVVFSLGDGTTEQEVEEVLRILQRFLRREVLSNR
ncbi:MAG: cysteine desulfurase [Candidatus Omnitrophica bacterium]|nr:cysteine desulfurase [Candidatus Omnitrophota bacterium]